MLGAVAFLHSLPTASTSLGLGRGPLCNILQIWGKRSVGWLGRAFVGHTLLSPSPILPPKARSYWFAMEALFALFFGVETLLRIHQLGLDYFLDAVLH